MRGFLLFVACAPLGAWAQYLSVGSGAGLAVASGTALATETLRILPGGSVHQSASGPSWLQLRGDLRNRGTYSKGLGTLRMEGSALQRIDGTTYVHNLQIHAPGGVAVRTYLSAENRIHLESGRLLLESDVYIYPGGGLYGSFDAATQVVADGDGRLLRGVSGPGAVFFPIGDMTGTPDYTPITVSLTAATLGASPRLGANLRNAKLPANASTSDYLTRYWDVSAEDLSGVVATVTATYTDADVVGTEAALVAARYDGANFEILDPLLTATNSLQGTVGAFGSFTAGEPGVLPVELLLLQATRVAASSVELQWVTASELNSAYFAVERAVSATFSETRHVGTVEAQGTTTNLTNYTFTDAEAPPDRLYYRLRQVDLDGSETLSPAVEVAAVPLEAGLPEFRVWPNPTSGILTLLDVSGNTRPDSEVRLVLATATGAALYAAGTELQNAGELLSGWFQEVPQGVYVVQVGASGHNPVSVRVVKH